MKSNYKRITAFVMMTVVAFGLITCKKEKIDPPTVKVFEGAITLNYTSASVSAEVTDQGGAEVKSRGFVYGLSGGSLDTIFCGSGVGVYSADFNNLQPNTPYVYEAFAKNAGGTGTSGKVTFTTRDHELPIVKTAEVENVGTTTASGGGNVTSDGGANITERGVCWSTNHNPNVSENHVSAGSGLGEFTCNMTDISANTTYYVRAYAKNSKGVAYGEERDFTTLDFDLPEVTTANVTDITQTTAKCCGEVTSDGGSTVTERGVCWSAANHTPTVNDHKTTAGEGIGSFVCDIISLNAHTIYYVRAYAINSKGVAYGETKEFNTSALKPIVSTGNVTDITTTSATGSGNVADDGGATVTERGFCWSTNHNPTIGGLHVAAGSGAGSFTAAMTNLTVNTTYYVRAYATNSVGTSYGDEVQFLTLSVSIPGVTTASVTEYGTTTATGGGNVISDGGAIVTERGICWGTSPNPTISGSHANSGTGMGTFTVNMTRLTPNTRYYVKAYAINSQGTAYGDQVDFTTNAIGMPTVTTTSATNVGQTTATVGGNVTNDGGATVTERGVCWSTNPNPTINGSHQSSGTGTGAFTVNMTGLTQNTKYYVKAYATNSVGTAYGGQESFTTSAVPTYTISVSANPTNGGTVTGGGTYQQGQSCTVKAIPAAGYIFQKWTENGGQVSTNANYTFNVTANRTLVAQFQAQSYTISASANPTNGGTVTGAGSYGYGQSCTLTATAATGYTFVKWTKNGTQVSTNASYTFTVTGSASYVAYFQANSYTISVSASPSNGGTVSGGGTCTYGQSCTVHAVASTGYTFVKWTENGSQVSTNANYTFTVTQNRSLVAHFTLQTYTISVSASPSYGGSVSGGGTYTYGQSCTVHASYYNGYVFTNWTANGSQVSTSANYTFTVTSNRSLVANFIEDIPIGAINGLFSVSATQQVYFSQGNLQYNAYTDTWRFATNQYDRIGEANSNISPNYNGWIDLFGWGTSGYNHGAVCYQPWCTSTTFSDYYAYGAYTYSLYDQTGQADWGYNAISNGGNISNIWRTLTRPEWAYVIGGRSTPSGIRYAKAQVNGVSGLILLPDNWSSDYFHLNSINGMNSLCSSNVIDLTTWTNSLQAHGAVFLPFTGRRTGGDHIDYVNFQGLYWSATAHTDQVAYGFMCMSSSNGIETAMNGPRCYGYSVRLVQNY